MHGRFERSRETSDNSIYSRWGIGFLALPALLVIALIILVTAQPTGSNWISEAVQAEFAGASSSTDAAPIQIARPAGATRGARTN